MDALSEVLKTIRLTGAAFFASELKAPWSIIAPPSRAIADALIPEADQDMRTLGKDSAQGDPDTADRAVALESRNRTAIYDKG